MRQVNPVSIRRVFAGLIILLLVFPAVIHPQSSPVLEVGKFSAEKPGDSLPSGWKALTFANIEKHTLYRLVKDGETTVVKAVSAASASGLIREMAINPREYPIVQWRWKIENLLAKGDVLRKEGDD